MQIPHVENIPALSLSTLNASRELVFDSCENDGANLKK